MSDKDKNNDVLEPSLYKYILRHTFRDQIILIVLTGISMPFVYISLDIPKKIINEAIGGVNIPDQILGYSVDQISYLLILSFAFLALILLNGGLKYVVNVYAGVVGERTLRRFRYELCSRILRFPLPQFKRVSQGEIIPMITSETEPLGGFIGDAFVLPAFQGGLLLTYLFFIFNQDWLLGLAAVALYPPQMWLIPKLQRKVNKLAKQRVRAVRVLADGVGETVSGVTEIHAHDVSRFERALAASKLGRIYQIRFRIFKLKFFIKFLNNFLAQLTPFFFYSVGGYFVIQGELSLGALVATIAAYKDITSPWKELLSYYQIMQDVRVKHAQIIEQFQPDNMLPRDLQEQAPETIEPLAGKLVASNLSYSEDEYVKALDAVNLSLDLPVHVAVVGLNSSGKNELSQLLSRLLWPTRGRIRVGEREFNELHEAVTGHRIAYAAPDIRIFNGTVAGNVFMGLKHKPGAAPDYDESERKQREQAIADAASSGNPTDDVEADWLDYEAAGVRDHHALVERAIEIFELLDFDRDAFQLGLYATVDPEEHPELTGQMLEARRSLHDRLRDPEMAKLVEPFDETRFNTNMSVGENLLFGSALDESFREENLSTNPVVIDVLRETGLYDDFLVIGRKVAATMVELFADVAPDSEMFERFAFIDADDLPRFRTLLKQTETDLDALDETGRQALLALPFKLIPARHRLGLIDDPMRARLVEARGLLKSRIEDDEVHGELVAHFDEELYNPAITLQDNILFGRIAYGQAHAESRVASLVRKTVEELGLRRQVIEAGLDFRVGIGGARLAPTQRQKIGLARCLIKRPDILIVNDATSVVDPGAELRILERIIDSMKGRTLIWVLSRPELASHFDQVLVMELGKVAEAGAFTELEKSGEAFQALLKGGA